MRFASPIFMPGIIPTKPRMNLLWIVNSLENQYGNRSCCTQWEDCGPWMNDDWEYVFGKKRPKATRNGAAGIDLSPSIRDYLGVSPGNKVQRRFVEEGQVSCCRWKARPRKRWQKHRSPAEIP